MNKNKVSVIMGSKSDWPIMKEVVNKLNELEIDNEYKIVSAHRTPERLYEFAKSAESSDISVIIAGAGGAAHLPGMVASLTHIPVLGVPIKSKNLKGMDSLLSIVQMPAGVPVATFAIGKAGAINSALYAASIISLNDNKIKTNLKKFRENQTNSVGLDPNE